MIDRSLERLLTETAGRTAYPRTPDLGARVAASLRAPASPQAQARRPAFAALVAAVMVVLAVLAIAPSRDAIARLFGVEGSRIEFLPTALPGETATPLPATFPTTAFGGGPTAVPGSSGLSTNVRTIDPVDLAEADELAGFEAVLPAVEEARLRSVLVIYGDQPVLEHRYLSFDLWQTKLRQDAGFGKGVPQGGIVQEVEVGGVPGTWLSGEPHFVYYYNEMGFRYEDSTRLVERNTLVWRTDAFFYRIETDRPLEEALRIAETLP